MLSREPRDVELLSGRLDPARLRRLLTSVVPARRDRPRVALRAAAPGHRGPTVLNELGVPRQNIHVELFYSDEPPPPVVRGRPVA